MTLSKTWFFGCTWIIPPNGISIGSPVFAQLTRVPNKQACAHKDHATCDSCSNGPHLMHWLQEMRGLKTHKKTVSTHPPRRTFLFPRQDWGLAFPASPLATPVFTHAVTKIISLSLVLCCRGSYRSKEWTVGEALVGSRKDDISTWSGR